MTNTNGNGDMPNAEAALRALKDFQRATVDYVFERLYAPGSSKRFLVADEVGLGKTLIARGVIAQAIEHLRGKVDRIDVVYICSNSDIARQNINRLKFEGEHVAFASRLASTPDRNGMLVEKSAPNVAVGSNDVLDYIALQNVARQLEHPDIVEYWKSAPYVLNFMDDAYKLKRDFQTAVEDTARRTAFARALSAAPTAALPFDAVEQYAAVEGGNGRIRALIEDTIGRGAHRLLWIPPSLPYYRLGGHFGHSEARGFTKRLVFSSWRLVPRAIASLVSYEAERQMVGRTGPGANTVEARKSRRALLRFARSDGRLTGMPVLALMYPSSYLAHACDPARLARMAADGKPLSEIDLEHVLSEAESIIEVALRRVPKAPVHDGPEDERWYWAAPLLLDRALEPVATQAWFAQKNLAAIWAGRRKEDDPTAQEEESDTAAWDEHVQEACSFALDHTVEPLGKVPADLVQALARIAVGAPGVTMLRSMLRVVGMRPQALGGQAGVRVRNGAAQAAWCFRGLFNQPEVMSLLAGDAPYWRQVLDYCVDGCLQSVLDEYAHVLRDHLGLLEGDVGEKVHEIADQICEAMSLRTANLAVHDLGLSDSGRTLRPEASPHFSGSDTERKRRIWAGKSC